MIGVAGHVAIRAVVDHAGGVTEAIPDRLTLAVLGRRALDLVGRRRRPPREVRRESAPGYLTRHIYARLLQCRNSAAQGVTGSLSRRLTAPASAYVMFCAETP